MDLAEICHPAGQVTAPDAELYAIRTAVARATQEEWVVQITIFTDSMAAAKRACDPSVHSSQGHSLAVCRTLFKWFEGRPDRTITFVQVPSHMKWALQYRAHEYARGLKVNRGTHPVRSLDYVRKRVTKQALDRWSVIFNGSPKYRGHQFLSLKTLGSEGGPLVPSYANGGTWIAAAGTNVALTARMTRCILAHAPIGEYYSRFNIDESTDCRCGEFQTRDHLLHQCDSCILPITGRIQYLPGLAAFLEENSWAFVLLCRQRSS